MTSYSLQGPPLRFRHALVILLSFTAVACTFSLDWYRHYQVEKAIERQDFERALHIFQQIIQNDPDSPRALEAARQGAHLAHLIAKNYALAVEFYRHIIVRSNRAEERKDAQKYIAQIQYEDLQDFTQAVTEYEKLLKLDVSAEEAFRYRLNLAKSQLKLNNIDQAVIELDVLLTQKHPPDEIFEARTLKANTLSAAKRLPEAAVAWQDILKQFPDKAKKESAALNLVVCYEEMKDFAKAIDVLQGMRQGYPHPDFLDLRIQRLRERMGNQPGAQGLKR
jgi:tetratricopeptide (TPR) repeat protein